MAMKPIDVSQLNRYIGRIMNTDPLLGNISVVGEISNLKHHQGGNVYFSLKDSSSKINCFLSAQRLSSIRYELEEGMEIVVMGYISVYEAGGYYSLNVKDVEVSGRGSLSIAFEKLKEKLEDEGLFDLTHKKYIPGFPKNVAVITAETGAAVKDIVKIITGKNNYVNVLIFPVAVQGSKAAPEITEALKRVNQEFSYVDTIILGRGGGSVEDLWAFNEEIIARGIFASKIPVISAVGHETDFTIADFVADIRGETPTAAAHIAVPDVRQVMEDLKQLALQLEHNTITMLNAKNERLQSLNPVKLMGYLQKRIELGEMQMNHGKVRLQDLVCKYLSDLKHNLEDAKKTLDMKNPRAIFEAGYAAIIDKKGRMVSGTEGISIGDRLTVVMADGEAEVAVEEIRRN